MRHLNLHDVTPVIASLHATDFVQPKGVSKGVFDSTRGTVPFVTISRQAGARGRSLATQLAERLNEIDPGPLPWTVWDDELVERVAKEHGLPHQRVAALEDERPSWLEEILGGLTITEGKTPADELAVYRRVAATIRALAELGRVIIVGRGGAYVARDIPDGVHVRLVAPLEFRVAAAAQQQGISRKAAAAWVKERDASRDAFYRRHWPSRPLVPENFTMLLNVSILSLAQQVAAILSVLPGLPDSARIAAIEKAVAAKAAATH
jgi:cytidylate kinase